MGKKKIMVGSNLRYEPEQNGGMSAEPKIIITILCVLCSLLVLAGCHPKTYTEPELAIQREQNARSDLKTIMPPTSINFEQPLSLEDVIHIGLRNNLELRIAQLNKDIQNKETLTNRLKMLPGLNAGATYEYRDRLRKSDVYNWKDEVDQKDYTVSELKDSFKADLTLTWNVLDTVLAYVNAGASSMQEQAMDKRMRRQAQLLGLDIYKAYWQAAAVEDALDYVHAVEKRLKVVKSKIDESVAARDIDRMDATEASLRLKELELTIRQLQANLSSARLELSRLMGLNQNVQYTLARPPIKPIVAALPHTKDLDIDLLEEYGLTHRPDLFETDINVMIRKQEAKNAFLRLFPGIRFFAGTHYDMNRLLLENTWNTVGAGLGMDLLSIPATYAALQGHEKAVDMAEANRLMMTVGVITQIHIALLEYAIKVDRFRLLEDAYVLSADLLKMAREKSIAGRLADLAVTQRHLEEMAAKLRRDESVVDMLVAHKRLCVSIGIDVLDCDANSLTGGRRGAGFTVAGSSGTSFGGQNELADDTGAGTGGAYDSGAGGYPGAGAGTGAGDTSGKKWQCPNCGYIHTGPTPPDVCPVCGTPGSKFKEYTGDEVSDWGKSDKDRIVKDTGGGTQTPGYAGPSTDRFLWKLQVGAFTRPGGPAKRLSQIKDLELRLMDPRDADVETKQIPGLGLVNRVRFKGLTQAEAKRMADELRQKGMEYWLVSPNSVHW